MNRRHFLAAAAAAPLAPRPAMATPNPESPTPLSFGLITDPQYADADPAGPENVASVYDRRTLPAADN